MASIIDNRSKTMLDSLKNTLKQAESVDILTAFFYISGFNALAEDLKDKKIRILVGCTIDPNAIGELCNAVKNNPDEELSSYSIRGYNNLNNSQKKNNYINSFIDLFNKSSLADGKDSTSVITSILHFNDSPKVEFSFDVAILAKNSDGDYCRLIHNKNYGIYDQWTWCQVPSSKDVRDKAIAIKENSFWGEVRTKYLDKKNMYLLRGDTNHPSFVVYVESVNETYNKYFDL